MSLSICANHLLILPEINSYSLGSDLYGRELNFVSLPLWLPAILTYEWHLRKTGWYEEERSLNISLLPSLLFGSISSNS